MPPVPDHGAPVWAVGIRVRGRFHGVLQPMRRIQRVPPALTSFTEGFDLTHRTHESRMNPAVLGRGTIR